MSDELKPCPFCGGVPKVYEDTVDSVGGIAADGGHYIGTCSTKCRCHFGGYFSTREQAITAWNTRSPDDIVLSRKELEGMKKLRAVGMGGYAMPRKGYEKWNALIDELLQRKPVCPIS